tara:strand:+ start:2711 stop:2923 length:213 start_codon:yes stop_codon:yes gene_type:complete
MAGGRMSIDELKDRIEVLRNADERLAMPADMAFSHHALMELQENLAQVQEQVQEAIQEIEDRMAQLGVEI